MESHNEIDVRPTQRIPNSEMCNLILVKKFLYIKKDKQRWVSI